MFSYFLQKSQSDDLKPPALLNRRTSDQWYQEDHDRQLWNEQFPMFQFLKQLSATDCSIIYLVKDQRDNQEKAVKIIPKIPKIESQLSVMKPEQIEFLQKYQLKNSVKIQQIQQSEQFYLVLMEYLKQGDLASYIDYYNDNMMLKFDQKHINWVIFCFKEIVYSVDELHQNGYIHRDLKPSNFLIDQKGHLKLTDFGLVHKKNKSKNKFCGTLSYMAPETLSNKNIIKSELIDVWSLGIILYELLMGHAPYDMDSKQQMLELIYSGYISFDPLIPEEFKILIRHLLQINPNKRMNMEDLKNHSILITQ